MSSLKTIVKGLILIAFLGGAMSLTSCNDSGSDTNYYYFNVPAGNDMNAEGYWKYCYDENYNATGIKIGDFVFSHTAKTEVYDGIEYKSWKGFCPSNVYDRDKYPNDWINHQWATVADDYNYAFMLGCWDVMEQFDKPESTSACRMTMTDRKAFRPQQVFMANTAYSYWSMLEGSAFSKAFGPSDYTFVRIYGIRNGTQTGYVDIYLAKNGEVAESWVGAELVTLGLVDELVFTMNSSDKGQWGMNVPAYFCMAGFAYSL